MNMKNNVVGRSCWASGLAIMAAGVLAHASDHVQPVQPASAMSSPAGTVAIVNGQPIARSTFDALVRTHAGISNPYDDATYQEEPGKAKAAQDVDRGTLLEDIILMEVLAQKARERQIHVQQQVIAEAELQYKTLLGQQLVREIIKEVKIGQDEIAARYRDQTPEQQYQVSHILVKSKAAAQAAIADIERGADFEKIARQRTIDANTRKDGNLGWLMLNQMAEPFAAAAGALSPGAYTHQPVETEYGWHVIRLHAKRDMKKLPLESMQNILRAQILQEKVQARLRSLRAEAKVEVSRQK